MLNEKEMVDHPEHYHPGTYEAINVIEAWDCGFNDGNAVKYIARHRHKENPVQDLKKARWYIDREIQRLERGQCAPEITEESAESNRESHSAPMQDAEAPAPLEVEIAQQANAKKATSKKKKVKKASKKKAKKAKKAQSSGVTSRPPRDDRYQIFLGETFYEWITEEALKHCPDDPKQFFSKFLKSQLDREGEVEPVHESVKDTKNRTLQAPPALQERLDQALPEGVKRTQFVRGLLDRAMKEGYSLNTENQHSPGSV